MNYCKKRDFTGKVKTLTVSTIKTTRIITTTGKNNFVC